MCSLLTIPTLDSWKEWGFPAPMRSSANLMVRLTLVGCLSSVSFMGSDLTGATFDSTMVFVGLAPTLGSLNGRLIFPASMPSSPTSAVPLILAGLIFPVSPFKTLTFPPHL